MRPDITGPEAREDDASHRHQRRTGRAGCATWDVAQGHLPFPISQGIKLYYRVLDVLVADQEAKGGAASTAALLRLDSFHRALLALSFEMVVASYRMVRPSVDLFGASV